MNCLSSAIKNLWQWGLLIKEMVSEDWLNQLKHYRTLVVGFSGGLDSTVLLHSLVHQSVLVHKIIAVHINHGLSTNANQWQAHCQTICHAWNIQYLSQQVFFDSKANLEDNARRARYAVFHTLIEKNDALLLGHHQDDQAETLLLQLFRGAGVEGLAAMPDCLPFGQGHLCRPLLNQTRQELETYANKYKLTWLDDESNWNCHYARNFLRQQVLPLIKTRWPKVTSNLARTAQHCQDAQKNLEQLAYLNYPSLKKTSNILSIQPLYELTLVQQHNVLRVWLKKNCSLLPDTKVFKQIIPKVIQAKQDANPEIKWGNYCIRRYKNQLFLLDQIQPIRRDLVVWHAFPNDLNLPSKLGLLKAEAVREGAIIPIGSRVEVRFRQGGEEFQWRGQKKVLKKLFQEWGVPTWFRSHIPLVYINEQLAVVVGYAISDLFFGASEENCYQIVFSE